LIAGDWKMNGSGERPYEIEAIVDVVRNKWRAAALSAHA
jgi:hypothetical protein